MRRSQTRRTLKGMPDRDRARLYLKGGVNTSNAST